MADGVSKEKELLQAAEKNDLALCKLILKEAKSSSGPFNIDCVDDSGTTPLQVAAYKGNLDLCKFLLAHGADVNHHEHKHGYTALMFACLSGKTDVVRLLLEHGAKTYVKNAVNRTASQMAGFVGYHHVVATINNFLPRYALVEYTKVSGFETEPKLPVDCLADFYHFVNQITLHPVRIALILRDRLVLMENEKKIISLLQLMCERFMKLKDDTNDRLAFKMHIYAEVLREIVRPEGEKVDAKKTPAAPPPSRPELTDKIDAFVKKMLVSRESDGYFLNLEKFVRRVIQHFPYLESELLQTIVRQLAPCRYGDANAPRAISTLNSAIFAHFFMRNEDSTCTACGDVLPVREDDAESQAKTKSSAEVKQDSPANGADAERKLRKCSACRVTQYCSVTCQKAHWFTHKRSCANLRAIRESNEEELREAERLHAREERERKAQQAAADQPEVAEDGRQSEAEQAVPDPSVKPSEDQSNADKSDKNQAVDNPASP